MTSFFLVLVVVLVAVALVFGVMALLSGEDPGLSPVEPDGRAVPLPTMRPLVEDDLLSVRFDAALRGYRMEQVDRALRRAAYDVGYKDEMISVLEAEVTALREGRTEEADLLRAARESATQVVPAGTDVAAEAPEVTAVVAADDEVAEVAEVDGAAGSDPADDLVSATATRATGSSSTAAGRTDDGGTGRSGD